MRDYVLYLHHLPRLQRREPLGRNLRFLERIGQRIDRRVDRLIRQLERAVMMRQRFLRASKDEKRPWPILRGSLRSHLRMTSARIQPKAILL